MPSREIKRRFTKSDVAIMAWRSAEVAANMQDKTARNLRLPSSMDGTGGLMEDVSRDEMLRGIEARMQGITYKMVNEDGQIDLRRLTGPEAVQYMNALGIPVVAM